MKETLKYFLIVLVLALVAAAAAYFALRQEEKLIGVGEIDRAPEFSGTIKSVRGNFIEVEGYAVNTVLGNDGPTLEVRTYELYDGTEFFIRLAKDRGALPLFEKSSSRASLKVGGWVMIYTKAIFQENTNTIRLPSAEGIKIIVDRVSILK